MTLKRWGGGESKANIQSQPIESVGKIQTFQNGGLCHGQECHENGELPVQDRSEKCISVHQGTSIAQQKITIVQVERENPLVPDFPFRTKSLLSSQHYQAKIKKNIQKKISARKRFSG